MNDFNLSLKYQNKQMIKMKNRSIKCEIKVKNNFLLKITDIVSFTRILYHGYFSSYNCIVWVFLLIQQCCMENLDFGTGDIEILLRIL